MIKKITLCLIAVLGVLSVIGGIFYFQHTDETKEGVDMVEIAKSSFKRFKPSDEFVKPIGRTHYSDAKRYISMSGSGIEFLCKGSYAYITVIGDGAEEMNVNHQARFAIYKDDELVIDDVVSYDKKKYHIDINDFEKGAVIRVVKLSEAKRSGFYIGTIGAFCQGNIEPTAVKDLKIEFIGDSLTCGYGIDAGPVGEFSTHTENFTKTYAYLTAEKLDADYSAVCFSGYGLLSGYTENGAINREGTVGPYYDKSALFYNGSKAYWDFNDFQPDFVVINLGANDSTYCRTIQRQQVFSVKYCDFIKLIRKNYPDAHIICALGDVNDSLFYAIEKAANDYIESTGDKKVHPVILEFNMDEYEVVIDGHPGADSNRIAAESLTEKIKEIINSEVN